MGLKDIFTHAHGKLALR